MSVPIINLALDLLEEEPILSIDDNRAAARWMKRNYEPGRDWLLDLHPWNFAIKRALLNAEADAPAFGWSKSYVLPSDCIRALPLTINGDPTCPSIPFVVEGRRILTNAGTPRALRYISRVTDPSLFTPRFTQTLATALGAQAASFITGKDKYAQILDNRFQRLMMQAQMVDGLEGTPERPEADDWVTGRFGGAPLDQWGISGPWSPGDGYWVEGQP